MTPDVESGFSTRHLLPPARRPRAALQPPVAATGVLAVPGEQVAGDLPVDDAVRGREVRVGNTLFLEAHIVVLAPCPTAVRVRCSHETWR